MTDIYLPSQSYCNAKVVLRTTLERLLELMGKIKKCRSHVLQISRLMGVGRRGICIYYSGINICTESSLIPISDYHLEEGN